MDNQDRAYKRGMIFMVIVVLIDAFCVDSGIRLAEGMWGHVLLIAAVCAIIYQELLFRGSVEDAKAGHLKRYCTFIGAVGFILFIWGIADIGRNGIGAGDFVLSKNMAELLTSVCWLSVGVTCWCRVGKARKRRAR